jgi:hypothetical protein
MLKIIGKLILQLSGWKIVDKTPLGINKYPKAVIIAVPHTSIGIIRMLWQPFMPWVVRFAIWQRIHF